MSTTDKRVTLNLVAHHTDNNDGSTSVWLYNNREELAKSLESDGLSIEDIESGDDPYEYGTMTKPSIELEIDPSTGAIKLVKPVALTSDG